MYQKVIMDKAVSDADLIAKKRTDIFKELIMPIAQEIQKNHPKKAWSDCKLWAKKSILIFGYDKALQMAKEV